jgi:hypothetical protein
MSILLLSATHRQTPGAIDAIFILLVCALSIPFLVAGLGWLSLGFGAVAAVATTVRLVAIFVMLAGLGDALISSSCDAEFESECSEWWEADGFPIFLSMLIVNIVAPLASAAVILLTGLARPSGRDEPRVVLTTPTTLTEQRRWLAVVLEVLPVIVGLVGVTQVNALRESGAGFGVLYLTFLLGGLGWMSARRIAVGIVLLIARLPFAVAAWLYLPFVFWCGTGCIEDVNLAGWAFFGFVFAASMLLPAGSAFVLHGSLSRRDQVLGDQTSVH